MAGAQQRYRGVRQRHGVSWVSEIRHPRLKAKIWLGKFETAEDAARAYDEAARLIFGPRARTNFPYNPNAPQSSSSKLLSATVTAKIHNCNMASLQITKTQSVQEPRNKSPTPHAINNNSNIVLRDRGKTPLPDHKILEKATSKFHQDGEEGNGLAPFLGKFKSMRTISKEGYASFMDHKILEKATSKFHQSNILGEGRYGTVYKAQFNDGSYAAVKKLDCASHDAEKEYENEVGLLCKFNHSNIISLLGYSSDNDTRFIVYKLMQNGCLETQLHGPSHGSLLTWHRRMKIALDTARGLEYLHEHCNPQVIHRDLKSSNILLDLDFNAKLSDFGLAVTDATHNKNNLKLPGTLGYVAPEYLLDGKLTDKSDVYAFGVVLLELLFGRKPVEKLAPSHYQSIVTWVMDQLTDRSNLPNIVDPVIKDTMDLKHLCQVADVAVLCVQPEPSYRPLITDVLHSLIPLVPVELGGTLRVTQPTAP